MRHEDVRNHLSDYIEGRLDSALAAAIENHLRECDGCRREETSLRAVFRILDDPALNVQPPPMFHADAMRKVRLAAKSGADRRGFWERLGWPRAVAAGAASLAILAALVLTVGPVGEGTHAGYTPEIRTAVTQTPVSVEVAGPVRTGEKFAIRFSGASDTRMDVRMSKGFDSGNWVRGAWDGHEMPLAFLPSAAGTVQDISFRLSGAGKDVALTVYIPVETGGTPRATPDWQPRPGETLRTALQAAARAYGVPIAAPDAALNTPVGVNSADANAATAIPAIARAAGLHAVDHNGTWQLVP